MEIRWKFNSELLPNLPSEEKFRLKDQIIRASRSTTNNIAEIWGKFHYKNQIKYCYQARGSCAELIDYVLIAKEQEFCSEEFKDKMITQLEQGMKLINGYINDLNKRAKQSS